ncbi:DUF721 domain-containing protein [Telluribacter sp.]|uniref:DUF721 domain-containing protein n=1 Tax=Telluribacter sp. TaxID=1978767 RepID=UPI002E132A03
MLINLTAGLPIFVYCLSSGTMAQYYKFDKEKSSRKPGITPLKEAIEQMLSAYKLKTSFNETYLSAHWEKIMGHTIASRTTKVYVKDRTLFLQIESAPLRDELVRAKYKIVELINREMNTSLIDDVVFI